MLSTFTVTNVADFGAGSLRQAIMQANGSGAPSTITFDIPGTGPQVISPESALPRITTPVTIDGYTQPGASPNTSMTGDNAVPLIVIDGAGVSNLSVGLQINGDNSTVEGLVIQNFNGAGVALMGANDTLAGDFIGTDPRGLTAQPNALGIGILGAGDVIGGTAPASRNLISGNSAGLGIANLSLTGLMSVSAIAGSVVQNNLIGTDATGSGDLGNTIAGVAILGSGNIIGGTAPGQANTIAYNGKAGSVLNLGVGVVIAALEPTASAPISVASSGDLISGNSIYGNHNMGIGLLNIPTASLLPLLNMSSVNIPSVVTSLLENINLGVSANNNNGSQTGPDNLENFPILASAVTQGGTTTVRGTLQSTPDSSFQAQFFSSPTASANGYGQGQVYLGQATVNTNSSGIGSFVFSPTTPVPVGQVIAATAIDGQNNSTEFSKAITVTAQAANSGPEVISVKRFGVKSQRQSIVITFNEQLDPTRAGTVGNYMLSLAMKKHHTVIKIKSAVYDPTALTVTLITKQKLKAHGPYTLTVSGTGGGLTDLSGDLLDGLSNGVPGSSFTTVLGAPIKAPKGA